MIKFSRIEVGQIQESIDRAVARMVRRYPVLRTMAEDIAQDAWIKFLAGYDRSRDLAATLARTAEGQDGPHKDIDAQGKACLAPGAYAYAIATTVAIDYARNRGGKLRNHDAHMPIDAPVKTHTEDTMVTLGDLLASALDDAPTTLGADARARAVQAAIASLSDSGRDAIEAWLNDQTMTGSQRIAKMRAIESIQESISAQL